MTQWVRMAGKLHKVVLTEGNPPEVDGRPVAAETRLLSPGVLSLIVALADGTTRSFRCIADSSAEGDAVVLDGQRFAYEMADPRSLRGTSSASADTGPRPLKAPMPGRVVRVLVANGEAVSAGQGLVVIEAMKMQNELKAPKAGVVARLSAAVGETVGAGATLLVVE